MNSAAVNLAGVASALLGVVAFATLPGGCSNSTTSGNGLGGGTSNSASSVTGATSAGGAGASVGSTGGSTASTGGSGGSTAATTSSSGSSGSGGSTANSGAAGGSTSASSASSSSSTSSSSTAASSSSGNVGNDGGAATDPALLLHYTFDDGTGTTAHDTSGNHNDGALMGSASWMTQGHVGGALVLSGTDPHVQLPADLLDTQDTVTIATWINLASITPWARIFDFGGSPGAFMYLVPEDGSNLMHLSVFKAATPTNREAIVTTPQLLPTNAWHHVAVEVSPTVGYQLYVDGSLIASTPPTPPNNVMISELAPTPTNWIGKSQFPTDPYLQGQLDDFRIYTRLLSSAEITVLASQ